MRWESPVSAAIIKQVAQSVIENLHITNGDDGGSGGAGIYVGDNVNATLRNNVIYGNVSGAYTLYYFFFSITY